MLTKVQKWGNSQGIRLPKHILEDAHIAPGDAVEIAAQNGQIVVKAAVRGKYSLKELVAEMPKDYHPREESWGKPIGKEEW